MTIRIDLHNHFASADEIRNLNLDKVLSHVSKKLGPGGIVGIVNFPRTSMKNKDRYGELKKHAGGRAIDKNYSLYFPEQDLWVVKGQEVPVIYRGEEVHLLHMGLRSETHMTFQRPSLENSLEEGKSYGSMIGADHPADITGIQRFLARDEGLKKTILPYFDMWGIFDGEVWLMRKKMGEVVVPILWPFLNNSAKEYYEENIKLQYSIGAVAESDGHSISEIGTSYTILDIPKFNPDIDGEEMINNLRITIKNNKDWKGKRKYNILHTLIHGIGGKKENKLRKLLERYYYT